MCRAEGARSMASLGVRWRGCIQKRLKFHLNLALLGFIVGRAYIALRKRLARTSIGRQ